MRLSTIHQGGTPLLSVFLVLLALTLALPAAAKDITGACCLVDGSCYVLTQSDCLAQQGSWLGPGTTCTPNPCGCIVERCTGACCFQDGTCQVMTQPGCQGAAGTWQGDNTVCDPSPCKGPSSAPEPGSSQHSWGKIKSIYR